MNYYNRKLIKDVVEASGFDLENSVFFQDIKASPEQIEGLRKIGAPYLSIIEYEDGKTEMQLSEETADEVEHLRRQEIYEAFNEDVHTLAIDIETYSDIDITECGGYKYVEDESFEVLLFAYSINGLPALVVDLKNGEEIPDGVLEAMYDPSVTKTAHNAAFERRCLSKYFGKPIPIEQWDCTMIRCARLGFPLSLDKAGEALGIKDKKMKEGKALIQYFCKPCKATKANKGRTRNLPEHAPEKWRIFKKYCMRDVDAEQEIRKKVLRFEPTKRERDFQNLDQRINDRGVLCDETLASNALRLYEEYKAELKQEAIELTELANPNSVVQVKKWLEEETGAAVESLNKKTMPDVIAKAKTSQKATRLLQIRSMISKNSPTKYKSMLKCQCKDGRMRGLLQFYGAVRTGRFAGRLVQLQNLPQNHLKELNLAREIVRDGDKDELDLFFDNGIQVLSELIRTALIAEPGKTFHVCDFSAIECRVLAWYAGEEWVLEVFRNDGDIYCATASKMFKVPVEKHGINADLRPKGKVSTLALGYQGAVAALKAMGGDKMGLTDEDMEQLVKDWRAANPRIVKFWKHVENAARVAITQGGRYNIEKGLIFERIYGGLAITLPSKRVLFYTRARIDPMTNRIVYEGADSTTKKWGKIETYGGKLTENIVQATARDILAEKMLDLDEAGHDIVFHVHDETITEANPGQTLDQVVEIFNRPVEWAKGLPLQGAGFSTPYYLKD